MHARLGGTPHSEASTRAHSSCPSESFDQTVRQRCAYRAYLKQPVPDALIRQVLEDARLSPSNCNTQPWQVHIVSGAKLAELSERLQRDYKDGKLSPDFTFEMEAFTGVYSERLEDNAKSIYQKEGGEVPASIRNLLFFNAPHACFIFMPSVGDNVRVAADIGMYAQTFWLSLTAHGLGGVAQTMLGYFADTVRETLAIDKSQKLLFGMSFGYPDLDAPVNQIRMGRAPIEQTVTFHE